MDECDLLIVGAGPAGLALASRFAGDYRIVESGTEIGGLCRSIEIDGGVFDIGGHSFHTPHPEVQHFVGTLMRGRWHLHERDARVWFDGTLIPYPFQRHFSQLPDKAVVERCRLHLPPPTVVPPTDNYENWILGKFGEGVAEHFMLPYNRKLFARDLRRIACDWVGQRVAAPTETPKAGDTRERTPLQPDTMVGYPADGGFVEIYRTMAASCRPVAFDREIVEIDPREKVATARSGERFRWRRLASTMPLPLLLRAIEGTPAKLVARADELERVDLRIVLLLVADPLPDAPHRIYLADPAIPPHKAAFNHTSSPSLRSRPVHAIMCEVSHSAEKPLPSDKDLETRIVDWLADSRLIPSRAAVARIEHLDVPFGYPVHTHARKTILAEAEAFTAPLGIHTLGRFGAWQYVNSDECIRQGFALAGKLDA